MTSAAVPEETLFSPYTRELVRISFAEDAPFGDMSSATSIPAGHISVARVIARESLIFCGERLIPILFQEFPGTLDFSLVAHDGDALNDGSVLLTLQGLTREILQIERPLLNFLQRLCGVASYTADVVSRAAAVTVLDTRKTMPGWRELDKYATRIGGARNHRFSLSDMILIKNNHVDAHGGDMAATLATVFERKPQYLPVQVEVRSVDELKQAIKFPVTALLLDNMDNQKIAECLTLIRQQVPQIQVEISGGITAERLPQLAAIGVPAVSIGSLTTAARNRDISLRIVPPAGENR